MHRLLVLGLALVSLMAACGGDEASDDGAAAPAGGGTDVDVVLGEFTIEPATISLDPGTYTFHVVNEGAAVHALEVEGPTGEVETSELGPGESADLTVDLTEDGEFEMYCPVGDHRDRGMEGTVTVGGGGGGATTDETTTEDDSGYGY